MLKSDGEDRITILRLLGLQLIVALLLGSAVFVFSVEAALSCWVGGAIAIVANGWMALVVFRPRAASSPQSLLISLYVGEMGKLLFVMAFFALAFKELSLLREPRNALVMFVAFLLVQAAMWLWPLVSAKAKTLKGQ
jgi:F0F1-type ATP synthase assembly protein I